MTYPMEEVSKENFHFLLQSSQKVIGLNLDGQTMENYIRELLNRFGMAECNPHSTLMEII